MAKVFLDANIFIDAIQRDPEIEILSQLENHTPCISPLSVHIYCYVYKLKVPSQLLLSQLEKFSLIDLTETILTNSIRGPTSDLEDNIQLHSAAIAECNFFLTKDKNLLKLGFFGKTRIVENLR